MYYLIACNVCFLSTCRCVSSVPVSNSHWRRRNDI